MDKVHYKPPKDPKHAALWDATPTSDRYRIDGERYIMRADGLIKLTDIDPKTIEINDNSISQH